VGFKSRLRDIGASQYWDWSRLSACLMVVELIPVSVVNNRTLETGLSWKPFRRYSPASKTCSCLPHMPSRRAESLPLVNEEAESSCISHPNQTHRSSASLVPISKTLLSSHALPLAPFFAINISLERANTFRATAPPSRLNRLISL
jgi:hypothetical protein